MSAKERASDFDIGKVVLEPSGTVVKVLEIRVQAPSRQVFSDGKLRHDLQEAGQVLMDPDFVAPVVQLTEEMKSPCSGQVH